jgi:hypothetical protein
MHKDIENQIQNKTVFLNFVNHFLKKNVYLFFEFHI